METDFSRYLRALRGDRTVAEVERGAAVNHAVIVRAEKGQRVLRTRTLKRLCLFYRADLNHAIGLLARAIEQRERERVKGY